MEKRNAKISITRAGGNASKNSLKYKVTIPTVWAQSMEISLNNRDIELVLDKDQIIIKKVQKN